MDNEDTTKKVKTSLFEKVTDKPKQFALLMSVLLLIGIGAYIVYRRWKKAKETAVFNNINTTTDPIGAKAKVYANQLRSAVNPSGLSWMINMDGSNTEQALLIGKKMKADNVPFSMVAQMYNMAYKDDLSKRLQSDLSSSELSLFYKYAGLNGIFDDVKALFKPKSKYQSYYLS